MALEGVNYALNYVLEIIDNLKEKDYQAPISYYRLKKASFEYRSYCRSGIEEIKDCLRKYPDQNPIAVIEWFRHQMDMFACKTKNGGANFMFSVYYDVATNILDELLVIDKEDK